MAKDAMGPVARIYVNRRECFIELKDIAADARPRSGYFRLPRDYANYEAAYALVVAAATNGLKLKIRTSSDITPDAYGNVAYLLVDF